MGRFLLHNSHDADECGAVYAAFKGGPSPLRRGRALASCLSGDHSIWWLVETDRADDAIALLPHYVAARTTVTHVGDVDIP